MSVQWFRQIGFTILLGVSVGFVAPAAPVFAGGSYDEYDVRGSAPTGDYGEVYRGPVDAGSVEHYERYGERSYDRSYGKDRYAPKYRGSTKDDYVGYPPTRYSYRGQYEEYGQRRYRYDPYSDHRSRRCIGRRQIKHALEANGWCDLAGYDSEDDLIYLKARRDARGPRYQLILDRCSGDLIRARPIRRYGKYLREYR